MSPCFRRDGQRRNETDFVVATGSIVSPRLLRWRRELGRERADGGEELSCFHWGERELMEEERYSPEEEMDDARNLFKHDSL